MECHQQCSVWLPATIGMAFSPLRWLSSILDIELLCLANMCENSRNPAVRNTSMFILPTIYNNGEKREKKDVDAKEAKEQGFFYLLQKWQVLVSWASFFFKIHANRNSFCQQKLSTMQFEPSISNATFLPHVVLIKPKGQKKASDVNAVWSTSI